MARAQASGGRLEAECHLVFPGVQGHAAEVEVGAQERGRLSVYLDRPAGIVSIGQNQVAGCVESWPGSRSSPARR